MKLIIILICLFLASCSFDSEKQQGEGEQTSETRQLTASELKQMDTSGDQISDFKKLQMGLNPFVAEIPKLRIRFLQNFKITVLWEKRETDESGKFTIDTRVGRGDPDFKYRVGRILVREKSFEEAARVGKFSTHHWGEIKERDLSWVSFPDIDPRFYHQNLLKYEKYFNEDKYKIKDIQITLTNTAKLKSHPLYRSVEDLKLNFYFYNYQRETWEQIKKATIERNFVAGQREEFKVVIENAPVSLIRDNFFSKGEFIVSEVEDFQIDGRTLSYKQLKSSVKNKSTQVIVNTPHRTDSYFVARRDGDIRLSEVLSTLFDKSFKIQENELQGIRSFKNNLPSFRHLKEVRDNDKKGRWFVFTKRLRRHYLDYEFGPGEVVNLSYITGSELARQASEKVRSLRGEISGDDDYRVYPLGNISPNSEVNFQLSPGRRVGTTVDRRKDTITPNYRNCDGNCYRADFKCHLNIHLFKKRNSPFEFDKDFTGEIQNLSLVINDSEYPLKELIEKEKVSVFWRDKNLHVKISDVEQIQKLNEARENALFLKIKTSGGRTFEGVRLTKAQGSDRNRCWGALINIAGGERWPVNTKSLFFSRWGGNVNWGHPRLSKSGDKSFKSPFTIGVSSTITNFHN